MISMKIQFLGTGAGVPSTQRNVSCIALKLLDERNAIWLFDCGEATQFQILKTNIKPRKVDKIFITHLHGDHIFGLHGFLSSRSFQGGTTPLDIYGPKGLRAFITSGLSLSQSHLKYPLRVHEIQRAGVLFEDQQFCVRCARLDHGIESFGYRIEEADYSGELLVEKLKALNIPAGPLYGRLKNGETISLPNGKTIQGADFVGKPVKGRVITILGDTRKTQNSVILAEAANVLIHESTFSKAEQQIARQYFHSTSVDAAQVAKKAKVKKLFLTHISARYVNGEAKKLQTEAREIFPNTQVVADFDEFEIPLHKSERRR